MVVLVVGMLGLRRGVAWLAVMSVGWLVVVGWGKPFVTSTSVSSTCSPLEPSMYFPPTSTSVSSTEMSILIPIPVPVPVSIPVPIPVPVPIP